MKILKPHSIISNDKIVSYTILESKATHVSTYDVIWWTLYIILPIYTAYTFYSLFVSNDYLEVMTMMS
jgi:hypothetical protein